MPRFINETGNIYGRFFVEDFKEWNKWGDAMWLCTCSCEKETERVVRGTDLRQGKHLSCGCVKRENGLEWAIEYNKQRQIKIDKRQKARQRNKTRRQ